jgi:hypothetical protein
MRMAHDAFYEKAAEPRGECFARGARAGLAPEIFLRARTGETGIIKNRWLADFKKGGGIL